MTITVPGTSIEAHPNGNDIAAFELQITSPSDGATTADPFTWPGGVILAVTFIPGSVTPTDLSDLTIVTGDNVDILMGEGANLSNTTPKMTTPLNAAGMPVAIAPGTALTVKWANAGNSKTMKVRFANR